MNSNFQSKGKKKGKKKEKRTQDYVIEWNYNTMAVWHYGVSPPNTKQVRH